MEILVERKINPALPAFEYAGNKEELQRWLEKHPNRFRNIMVVTRNKSVFLANRSAERKVNKGNKIVLHDDKIEILNTADFRKTYRVLDNAE